MSRRRTSSLRLLAHVSTRAGFLLPLFVAAAALGARWPVIAAVFAAIALLRAVRQLSDPNLPTRVRLGSECRRRGIKRPLSRAEATAILAVESYADDLVEAGAAPKLGSDTVDRAWRIIADAGPQEATENLRAFWSTLPKVAAGPRLAKDEELIARLNREVESINAAEREIEGLRL